MRSFEASVIKIVIDWIAAVQRTTTHPILKDEIPINELRRNKTIEKVLYCPEVEESIDNIEDNEIGHETKATDDA
jgi:hypothetical protein